MSLMQGEKAPARVAVIEDHPLVQLGLSYSLASHPRLNKCGEADCEVDAWQMIKNTSPDAVIVDITLRTGTGLDLIRKLSRKRPDIRVIVSSMYDKSIYEQRSLNAGASAYISKTSGVDVLLSTVEDVVFAQTKKQHSTDALPLNTPKDTAEPENLTSAFTDRELQVFRQIGRGMSTRQIAEELCRSVKTIESYKAKLKKKTGANSAEELARDAVRWVFEHDAA